VSGEARRHHRLVITDRAPAVLEWIRRLEMSTGESENGKGGQPLGSAAGHIRRASTSRR
jgi:hypothetical protein